jgi:hypothetical protein
VITLVATMAVTGSASGMGLANDAVPANHQPSVTVTDMGVSTGFQDTQFGHLERGRALIAADFDLDGRNDFFVGNPGEESYILLNTKSPRGTPLFVHGAGAADRRVLAGSAVAADYDNDGDPDLFVGVGGLEGSDTTSCSGTCSRSLGERTSGSRTFRRPRGSKARPARIYEADARGHVRDRRGRLRP